MLSLDAGSRNACGRLACTAKGSRAACGWAQSCPQECLRLPRHPRPAAQATLAACNVAATLQGHPAWNKPDVLPFVDGPFEGIPKAAPSLVNAKELGLEVAP